jgi:hypothetical protein
MGSGRPPTSTLPWVVEPVSQLGAGARPGRVTHSCFEHAGQQSGPLRWAAVEAGKWVRGRPGHRIYCDALSSSVSMVLGATDRNCRLLP